MRAPITRPRRRSGSSSPAARATTCPEPVLGPSPEGAPPRIGKPSDEVFPGGSHDVPWRPEAPGEPLEVEYAGAGAWAALDGTGTVELAVDGEATGSIVLDGPGLYELSGHPEHGMHEVRLDIAGDVRVWSLAVRARPRALSPRPRRPFSAARRRPRGRPGSASGA